VVKIYLGRRTEQNRWLWERGAGGWASNISPLTRSVDSSHPPSSP